jgi:hypothetical protein
MYILNNMKCERCGGDIQVISYGREVDRGECTKCSLVEILPSDDYKEFVDKFCVKK